METKRSTPDQKKLFHERLKRLHDWCADKHHTLSENLLNFHYMEEEINVGDHEPSLICKRYVVVQTVFYSHEVDGQEVTSCDTLDEVIAEVEGHVFAEHGTDYEHGCLIFDTDTGAEIFFEKIEQVQLLNVPSQGGKHEQEADGRSGGAGNRSG